MAEARDDGESRGGYEKINNCDRQERSDRQVRQSFEPSIRRSKNTWVPTCYTCHEKRA